MQISYFDAAVFFYDQCVKRLKKDELLNKKTLGIFQKKHLSSISVKKAEYLLNRAIESHDLTWERQGNIGVVHRCNSRPYRQKVTDGTTDFYQGLNSSLAVNNSSHVQFNASIWRFQDPASKVIDAKMFDKMCVGGQLKVSQ